MTTLITANEVIDIFKNKGMNISYEDAKVEADQCNENATAGHRGMNAYEWAERWAIEEFNYRNCCMQDRANFQYNAYGE